MRVWTPASEVLPRISPANGQDPRTIFVIWSDAKGTILFSRHPLPVVDPLQVIAEAVCGTRPPIFLA